MIDLNRKKFAFLFVLALWAVIYLPGLGRPEFKGEEGRRVFPAINMLKTGDWIVPRIAEEEYCKKPPGINWLIAISFLITHQQTEFAARLVSVAFIFLVLAAIFGLSGRYFSTQARLIAAIIYLTNFSMLEKGRLIEIEATYTSLTAIAMIIWISGFGEQRRQWLVWPICGILLGFGLLVKGPFVAGFFYLMVLGVLWRTKKWRWLFSFAHLAGFAIMAVMFFGWYFAAESRVAGGSIGKVMSGQLLTRILPHEIDWGHWAKEILDSLVGLLPWILFAGVLWGKKPADKTFDDGEKIFSGALWGLIAGFAAMWLMPNGESRYSMPLYGLASILLGRGLAAEGKNFSLIIKLTVITACVMLCYNTFGISLQIKYLQMEKFRPAAADVNRIVPADKTIYLYRPGFQTFCFYLRGPLEYILDANDIDQRVEYLIVKQSQQQELGNLEFFRSRRPEVIYNFSERITYDFKLIKLKFTDE